MNQITGLDHKLVALADPTRRAILELLVQQPYRASDLADRARCRWQCRATDQGTATGVTRSRMSKHLKVLLDAGIARDERPAHDARGRVFHLHPDAMRDMRRWLDELQRHWDAQLQSFKQHVERHAESSDDSAAT